MADAPVRPNRAALQGAPLLSMRGIDKAFGGVPALHDARLDVGRGEVHALIGQNGAGKSTLIKILTGAYARDAGRIEFEGRSRSPSVHRSKRRTRASRRSIRN